MPPITDFMDRHYKHFNARETRDAARAYGQLISEGGQMFLAMAGAMSTAELGISLAEMIRRDKIHGICCTAANLEEDIFNLFAHEEYVMVTNYRDLSPADEKNFLDRQLNRVTDTCIPESVMLRTEKILIDLWSEAAEQCNPKFPYEFIYDLLDRKELRQHYQIPAEHSWVLAAKEKNLEIFTPGFEDSTLGSMLCGEIMRGRVKGHQAIRHGTEQLERLGQWYIDKAEANIPIGFFQIGGGIAGDFSISAVPMLIQDYHKDVPYWAYFAQISDSTTSYGSYSGAVPNEKITWAKVDVDTPKFMINSDASIVAPLIFAYVLGE
jgi:deoxyhypusine synthase